MCKYASKKTIKHKQKNMNILCLSPHPDDLEFGAAGTLIRYADAGHIVYLMIMTQGSMGGDPGIRFHEQEKSGKIIGAKRVFWGGFEDTKLETNSHSISIVEKIIKQLEPDIIFSCYGDDTHQDHRNLNTITNSAARNFPNVLFYETVTSAPSFSPNVFCDIESVLERKIEALKAHDSQMLRTNIANSTILELAAATATFRGTQSRVKKAEAFMSRRYFLPI